MFHHGSQGGRTLLAPAGKEEAQTGAVTFTQAHPAGQDQKDLQPPESQHTQGTG